MAWTTAAELAGPGLAAALDHAGRSLGTDRPDIQGQRVIELVAWQFAIPLAHALLDGRPPPRMTRLWVGDEAPEPLLEDGEHPSLEAWREDLNRQLAPLIHAISATTRRPRTALERGVQDRIAGAIVWIAQTTGREDQAEAITKRVATGAEVRTFDAGGHRQLLHVREGCCLYYRIPGTAKCWSCPLLTDDDRRALAET